MLVSSIGLASAQGTPIQDIDLTAETFNLSGSYSDGSTTSTKTKVTYAARGAKQSNNIQINTNKNGKKSGVVSTANPSNLIIEKVVVSATDMSNLQVTMGNTANTYVKGSGVTSNTDNDVISGVISGTNGTYTPTKNYKFFCVMPTGGTQIQKIQVYYKNGDTESTVGNVVTTPAAVNEDITISEGTSIIFASENADKLAFKVDDEAEETVDNPYTYTPAKDVIVTVTPVDNGTKVEDKTAVFTITIKQAEVWSLVASLGDMPLDGQYIIVSNDGQKAMSNEVYSNYRKLTDVTVENGSLIEPSSSVLRFVVEKEGDSYLWKTLNYGGENGSNKEVYLNVAKGSDNYLLANNPNSSNQGRRNTTVSFNGENVNIDFTLSERSVRYNAGSTRFAAYLTSNKDMSKTENLVKLYRLGGTPMPKFTQNADGAVVFVSKAGELHIRLENRDKDGNPIVDVASSMLARAAEVEWTNKVAEESEEYVIPVPTEPVHTVYIEAKSVNNGIHSEVNKLTLNQEGTTTGIEGVEAENENAPVEYFNLQGVRVQNPGQGLYIRRQGNRVEKVALR